MLTFKEFIRFEFTYFNVINGADAVKNGSVKPAQYTVKKQKGQLSATALKKAKYEKENKLANEIRTAIRTKQRPTKIKSLMLKYQQTVNTKPYTRNAFERTVPQKGYSIIGKKVHTETKRKAKRK